MNRGPLNTGRAGLTFVEKAELAHGAPLADWLAALAECADRAGLGGAGKLVGYSASAISTVLGNKYAGDVGRVQSMVRGALMSATVTCPILGEIGRDRCLSEQKEPFRATSAFRAQLFHACKSCPNRHGVEQ